MARPALATIADLEAALATEVDNEDQAMSLLERASAIVRAYAHTTWLNDDEDALEDVPADIPGVVVGMVERATRNPSGVTQEQSGPFARSFGPDAAGRLYLTRWDRLVIKAAAGDTGGLQTLGTTRGNLETAPVGEDLFPEEVTIPWPS